MDATVKQEHDDSTDQSSEINVKVISLMNELDLHFRIKRDEPPKQLFIKWSVRADIKDYNTIRFLVDGKRVKKDQTPDQVGPEGSGR